MILLKNLSDKLVNGLRGNVTEISNDTIGVDFNSVTATIQRTTFTDTVFSALDDKVVASRVQFPLDLAYATTVHKAQGLTLSRVEVDCVGMTTPGQFAVAIGRCINKKGLRIVNFDKSCIRKHPEAVYNVEQCHSLYKPNLVL